ncbi:LexA family transcriptional regulator [Shewanella algae]|uniref:LexA family transcriptional regulator n=1 Tax=Shewanella algae TaxID=38313 RepID=UPI0031F4B6AD
MTVTDVKKEDENWIDDPILDKQIGSIPERLQEIIGDESIREIARKVGISEGAMRTFLKGRTPKLPDIIRIAKYKGVNWPWLATGEGSKYPGEQTDNEVAICPGDEFDEEYALINGFHAQVSAGHGAVWDDEKVRRKLAFRTKWLRFRGLHPENLRVVFAKGDSMEPTIHTGDSILVDITQTTLTDGSIFVLRLGDELYAKRLQKHINGSVTILSDNKEYQPQVVTAADLPMLNIVGKVVWIGKDVK